MKLEIPFPEYGYFGPKYYCDRERETKELIDALADQWQQRDANGSSTYR